MIDAGSFTVGADHPALPGHFPGHPVVPGVVLLDRALLCIGGGTGGALRLRGIASAKFLAPVAPGDRVDVRYAQDTGDTIRLRLEVRAVPVASATVTVGERTA